VMPLNFAAILFKGLRYLSYRDLLAKM
jgi:hypothetical protein